MVETVQYTVQYSAWYSWIDWSGRLAHRRHRVFCFVCSITIVWLAVMEIQADLHLAEREERVGREDGSVSYRQGSRWCRLTWRTREQQKSTIITNWFAEQHRVLRLICAGLGMNWIECQPGKRILNAMFNSSGKSSQSLRKEKQTMDNGRVESLDSWWWWTRRWRSESSTSNRIENLNVIRRKELRQNNCKEYDGSYCWGRR